MKNALFTIAILGFFTIPAIAADDFSGPFTNTAPAGFSDIAPADDQFDMKNFDPNAIEPAAGDEDLESADTPSEAPEIDNEETPSDETSAPVNEISL